MPCSVSNQQPTVIGVTNQHSYLQPLAGGNTRTYSQPLVSGDVQIQANSNVQSQTDATLIGQDLWKQLSVPVFTGDLPKLEGSIYSLYRSSPMQPLQSTNC